MQANFRNAPVADIPAHMALRAHRRYNLAAPSADVTLAWGLLVNSTYSQDLSVQDGTGIPHLPGSGSQFAADRFTPLPVLCTQFAAWTALLAAAPAVQPGLETFRYDLINLGRGLLAQLSTPTSQNFSDAFEAATLDAARLAATGSAYVQLLADADALVATDSAFLIGPVIAAARALGAGAADCGTPAAPAMSCPDFLEWNVRSQLTTWNPTPAGAPVIPGGPIDYASKHWSGLISGYYQARASLVLTQALADAAAGRALNKTAIKAIEAAHAYSFQNDFATQYPVDPVGDALAVSQAMYAKYAPRFAPYCPAA